MQKEQEEFQKTRKKLKNKIKPYNKKLIYAPKIRSSFSLIQILFLLKNIYDVYVEEW